MKWVCLHGTIAVPQVHWTILSHNLSLKVDFLFRVFLVITVGVWILTNIIINNSKL